MTPKLVETPVLTNPVEIKAPPKQARKRINSEAGPSTTKKPRITKPLTTPKTKTLVTPKAKTPPTTTSQVRVTTKKVRESKASLSDKLSWKVAIPHISHKNVKASKTQEIRPRLWSANRDELTSAFAEISGSKCVNNVSWAMTDMPIVILDDDSIQLQLQQLDDLAGDLSLDMIIARDFTLPASNLPGEGDTNISLLDGLPTTLYTMDPPPSTSVEKIEPEPTQITFGISSSDTQRLTTSTEVSGHQKNPTHSIKDIEHQSGTSKLFIKIPPSNISGASALNIDGPISPDGSKNAALEADIGQKIISKPRRSPRETGLPNNLRFRKGQLALVESTAAEKLVGNPAHEAQSLVLPGTVYIPHVQSNPTSSVLPEGHDQPPFMHLSLGTDARGPMSQNTTPKGDFPPLRLDVVANHTPFQSPFNWPRQVSFSTNIRLPHVSQQHTADNEIPMQIPGLITPISVSSTSSSTAYTPSSAGKPIANITRKGISAQLASTVTPYIHLNPQLKLFEPIKSVLPPAKSKNSTKRRMKQDKGNDEKTGSCNITSTQDAIMNGEGMSLDLRQASVPVIIQPGRLTVQGDIPLGANLELLSENGPGDVLPPLLGGAKKRKGDVSASASGSRELAAPKKRGRPPKKAKLGPEPVQPQSPSLPESGSQELTTPKKRGRPPKKAKLDPKPVQFSLPEPEVSKARLDPEPVQPQSPSLPEPEVSKAQIANCGIPTPLPPELQVLIDAYINGVPVAMFADKNRLNKYWGVQVASEVQYVFMGLYRVLCVVESLESTANTSGSGSEGVCLNVNNGMAKGRAQWRFRLKWETGGEDWSASDDDAMERLSTPWWNPALGPTIIPEDENQKEDEISTFSYRIARKEKELVDGYHPFRYLYYSVLPIQLLAPVDAEIPDTSFSRGWYCMDCGKLNFRFFLRHTRCDSSLCKSKPYIPGYAIDIDDLRDPHDILSLSLPMDEYSKYIEMKAQNWTDKMQTSVYTLDQFRKVAVTHIFTCNLRDLQNEATDLFNQIQKDVPLRRQVGDGNPYFMYYAGDKEDEPFESWKSAPRCLKSAKQLMLDRGRKYGKKASNEMDINQLVVRAWVSLGSKRGSDLLCAKERCMVIMCLGCEVIMSINPKSIMNDDHIRMPDLAKLIKFEDGTSTEDGIESSSVNGVDEVNEINKMEEVLPSEVSNAPKKVKLVEKSQKMSFSVTLVHGDILLLEGDDFEYTLKRTGTSIMLFGSCTK